MKPLYVEDFVEQVCKYVKEKKTHLLKINIIDHLAFAKQYKQ